HRPQRLPALPVRPGTVQDLSAAGLLHVERQGGPHHHPACVGGRPRTDGQLPQNGVGQGDLQATQGDGGALVCRRQTAARAPLCALAGADEGDLAMSAGGGQPEHKEDRAGAHPPATPGGGMRPSRPFIIFTSSGTGSAPALCHPAQTKNPPKNRRVCQWSEGRQSRASHSLCSRLPAASAPCRVCSCDSSSSALVRDSSSLASATSSLASWIRRASSSRSRSATATADSASSVQPSGTMSAKPPNTTKRVSPPDACFTVTTPGLTVVMTGACLAITVISPSVAGMVTAST